MQLLNQKLGEYFQSSANALDILILRILDLLHPEISSKQLRIELDLDRVCLSTITADVRTAISGMMFNFIHSAREGSDIAITLIDSPGIDTPGHWEFEICDLSEPCDKQWPSSDRFGNCDMTSRPGGDTSHRSDASSNLSLALAAAKRCGGNVEAWHCPQGGIAMILIVPKTKADLVTA